MKKQVVEIIDDIDGQPAYSTVQFSVSNKDYEIDLSKEHYHDFMDQMSKWIKHARRVRATRNSGSHRRSNGTVNRSLERQWLIDNGYHVGHRGRISEELLAAYRKAQEND